MTIRLPLHSVRVLAALLLLPAFLASPARAETRGRPYTEERLLELSQQVFVGEVLETTTYEPHGLTLPTKVRVLLSVKGKVEPGPRPVTPKDPGIAVYFDEEFDRKAEAKQIGLFYVGTKDRPGVLMGYKRIVAAAAAAEAGEPGPRQERP